MFKNRFGDHATEQLSQESFEESSLGTNDSDMSLIPGRIPEPV